MWGSVVATLLLLALAATALPSGNLVRINQGGYFTMPSLSGYSAIAGNAPFTMSAWIYTNSNAFPIFNVGPSNLGQCGGEGGFGVSGNNRAYIFACNYDGTVGNLLLTGGWHHVAIVHSASGSIGYLDGVRDWSSTVSLNTQSNLAFIGARAYQPSGPDAHATFWLDDLRIWSRALSQSELQFDMHGGAVPTGLVGNYNGSSTNAGQLLDAVNFNHGVISGTAAPTYSYTVRCPEETYIASCGALSCSSPIADLSIFMCGPCLRGYSSAVYANLTGYCDLDFPDLPTSVSYASINSTCVNVFARWPVRSAAIAFFKLTRVYTALDVQIMQNAGSPDSTTTLTLCGLDTNVPARVIVQAINVRGYGPFVEFFVTANGSNCAAGSYGSGGSPCSACPAGTFSLAGANDCTFCPAGRFAPSSSSSVCTQCAAGTFQCSRASTSCDACAVGKYASNAGQSECSSCAAGSFGSTTGSSACISCNNGTFSASLQSTACSACAINSYASFASATTCTACSFGTWTSTTGSTSCIGCSVGTYATTSSGGVTTCSSCPSTCIRA